MYKFSHGVGGSATRVALYTPAKSNPAPPPPASTQKPAGTRRGPNNPFDV